MINTEAERTLIKDEGKRRRRIPSENKKLASVSPLLRDVPPELRVAVATRMCIPEELGFCYFRIPKAANSTIVKTLAFHMSDATEGSSVSKLKGLFKNFSKVSQKTKHELLSENFCWTFVRNPYDRILSAYFSKIRNPESSELIDRRYSENRSLLTDISFKDFIRLVRDRTIRVDPHWAPQMDLLPISPTELHFVGRVESIEVDLPPIIEKLTGRFDGIFDHVPGRRGTSGLVKDYYGAEERRIVREYYARDFEALYPNED